MLVVLGASQLISCGDDTSVTDPSLPGDLVQAIDAAAPEQKVSLQDGKIEFDEYERAVFAALSCVEAEGYQLTADPKLVAGNQYRWEFVLGPDRSALRSFSSIFDDCWKRYANAVSALWAYQNRPSEKTLQDARDAFGVCLRDSGLLVPEHPSAQDLVEHRADPRFGMCSRQVSEQFELPDFGG